MAAMAEQREGPQLSISLPAKAAKGYWPIMALRDEIRARAGQGQRRSSREDDRGQLRLGEPAGVCEDGRHEGEGEDAAGA
jgi:hypothetical protein